MSKNNPGDALMADAAITPGTAASVASAGGSNPSSLSATTASTGTATDASQVNATAPTPVTVATPAPLTAQSTISKEKTPAVYEYIKGIAGTPETTTYASLGVGVQGGRFATPEAAEASLKNYASTWMPTSQFYVPGQAASIVSRYAPGTSSAILSPYQTEFWKIPNYGMEAATTGQMMGRTAEGTMARGDVTNPNAAYLALTGQVAPYVGAAAVGGSVQSQVSAMLGQPISNAQWSSYLAMQDPGVLMGQKLAQTYTSPSDVRRYGEVGAVANINKQAQTAWEQQYGTGTSWANVIPMGTGGTAAADIAAGILGRGGTIGSELAAKAAGETTNAALLSSLSKGITGGTIVSGVSKQAYQSKSELAASQLADLAGTGGAAPSGYGTTYVPYGNYVQEAIKDTKLGVNPQTGEIAIYQKVSDISGGTRISLVGGGGIAAAQSGAFTVTKPETPFVIQQVSAQPAAKNLLLQGTDLANTSRLGAQATEGFVKAYTSGTPSSAQYGQGYANIYNLANYASPQGVNLPKSQMDLSNIPWGSTLQVSKMDAAPFIQTMTGKGLTGQAAQPTYAPATVANMVGDKIAGAALQNASILAPTGAATPSTFIAGGSVVGIAGTPSTSPFAASAAEQMILPKPFVSTAAPTAAATAAPSMKVLGTPAELGFAQGLKPGQTVSATEWKSSDAPTVQNFLTNLAGNTVNTIAASVGISAGWETRAGYGSKETTTLTGATSLKAAGADYTPVMASGLASQITETRQTTYAQSYKEYLQAGSQQAIGGSKFAQQMSANVGAVPIVGGTIRGAGEYLVSKPIDVAAQASLAAIGGAAFGAGEAALGAGSKALAGSSIPTLAKAGEALLSPAAVSIGTAAKYGMGAIFVGQTAYETATAKSEYERGGILVGAVAGTAGFAAGYGAVGAQNAAGASTIKVQGATLTPETFGYARPAGEGMGAGGTATLRGGTELGIPTTATGDLVIQTPKGYQISAQPKPGELAIMDIRKGQIQFAAGPESGLRVERAGEIYGGQFTGAVITDITAPTGGVKESIPTFDIRQQLDVRNIPVRSGGVELGAGPKTGSYVSPYANLPLEAAKGPGEFGPSRAAAAKVTSGEALSDAFYRTKISAAQGTREAFPTATTAADYLKTRPSDLISFATGEKTSLEAARKPVKPMGSDLTAGIDTEIKQRFGYDVNKPSPTKIPQESVYFRTPEETAFNEAMFQQYRAGEVKTGRYASLGETVSKTTGMTTTAQQLVSPTIPKVEEGFVQTTTMAAPKTTTLMMVPTTATAAEVQGAITNSLRTAGPVQGSSGARGTLAFHTFFDPLPPTDSAFLSVPLFQTSSVLYSYMTQPTSATIYNNLYGTVQATPQAQQQQRDTTMLPLTTTMPAIAPSALASFDFTKATTTQTPTLAGLGFPGFTPGGLTPTKKKRTGRFRETLAGFSYTSPMLMGGTFKSFGDVFTSMGGRKKTATKKTKSKKRR